MWADAPPPLPLSPVWGPDTTDNNTEMSSIPRYCSSFTALNENASITSFLATLQNISIKRAGHHNLPVDRWKQRISA